MNQIKKHFSKTVDDYDTVVEKVVFKNDELHDVLVGAINFDKDKDINVLDLGCGTGHGIGLVAKLFPKAEITGIDFSKIMIDKAKKYLKSSLNRIRLLETDFNDCDFDQDYDVIISAIAIHNSTHEEKKKLFDKIFSSLKNGGMFINADFYKHESADLHDGLKNVYRSYLKQNLKGDELNVWLKHAFEEDKPMPLTEQSSLLKEAGFDKFELLWIFNNEAIYVARK